MTLFIAFACLFSLRSPNFPPRCFIFLIFLLFFYSPAQPVFSHSNSPLLPSLYFPLFRLLFPIFLLPPPPPRDFSAVDLPARRSGSLVHFSLDSWKNVFLKKYFLLRMWSSDPKESVHLYGQCPLTGAMLALRDHVLQQEWLNLADHKTDVKSFEVKTLVSVSILV